MQVRAWLRRALAAAAGAMITLGAARVIHAEDKDGDNQKRTPIGVYADLDMGPSFVVLNTLAVDEVNQSVAMTRKQTSGFTVGGSAGLRLAVVTIGPRVTTTSLDATRLTLIGGELGVRFPIDRLEIRASLGGGTASRSVDAPDPAQGLMPAGGFYATFGVGLGVRVAHIVMLGGGIHYDILALTPSGVGASDLRGIANDLVAGRADQAWSDARNLAGSGYGTALGFSAGVGIEF